MTTGTATPPQMEAPSHTPAQTRDGSALGAPLCWPFSWRHLDLFSGIGGFALACRMVGGIETVGFCEREPYAQRVLKKHWPDVPICNDIHEMKGNDYGPINLITGGFPCQPYSLAGERRGNEDDRALWPQMLRVISEARPAWVLGENVPGIITLALDGVLADLEGEGYACQAFCIPACGVDARHRRERIWIVAHRSSQRRQQIAGGAHGNEIENEGWSSPHDHESASHGESCGSRALADSSGGEDFGGECRDVAEASGCRPSGNASADAGGQDVALSNGINGRAGTGRQNGTETRHTGQALPDAGCGNGEEQGDGICGGSESARWLTEPDVGRVAHGIPSRVDRLKGLGNAIVPQVAAEIIAAMKRVDIGANVRDQGHLAAAQGVANKEDANGG
jgi:DNA (cytosine-5)-methyltransferase 1